MKLHPKILVLIAVIAASLASHAYDCKIDGIYYNLDRNRLTASVTGRKEGLENKDSYKDIVTIPESITYNRVPYRVTKIGAYAFAESRNLTQVNIPESVTEFEAYAFRSCSKLSQINIPESVVIIGHGTFEHCWALTHIDIPESVTEIEAQAFSSCSNLIHINIPKSVTKIGNHTFNGCRALTQIEIPDSVTGIGSGAFIDCGLTSICIPASVTKIHAAAFCRNNKLKILTILNPDIEIAKDAFLYCNIEELVVPDPLMTRVRIDGAKIIGLNDFNLRTSHSLDEFVKTMPFEGWETYYKKRHKATPYNASAIADEISARIEQWQKKGEFESTAAWQQRVNDNTRQQKIDSIKAEYTARSKEANKAYADEYNRLQKEYETAYNNHYNSLISKYYEYQTKQAQKKFVEQKIELNAPYDADNQSFLINTSSTGDILLPIPVADAPSFKADWNTIRQNIRPVFVPDGDEVALNKVIFTHNGKQYVYDSHTEAKYAVADISYNFSPVEVSDLDLDGIEISATGVPDLPVAQTIGKQAAADAISVKKVAPETKSVTVGSGGQKSDIDRNIPHVKRTNDRTFALIVANENYRRECQVQFAANDGRIFAEYLKKTLGVPDDNIQIVIDGSLNDIKFGLNKLSQICDAFPDEASVIVYYAGHGIPDEASKDAYLLPVDGYGSDPSTGYSLRDLYSSLASMPARQTTVFLDACFSGSERSGNMMASARGVRIKPKAPLVDGNVVVLSATMDDETAYPYEQENHGMFTYFLLKKLQETKGDVSLGELVDFVITKVKQTSILKNDKIQTPTVTASPKITDWQNIRL